MNETTNDSQKMTAKNKERLDVFLSIALVPSAHVSEEFRKASEAWAMEYLGWDSEQEEGKVYELEVDFTTNVEKLLDLIEQHKSNTQQ